MLDIAQMRLARPISNVVSRKLAIALATTGIACMAARAEAATYTAAGAVGTFNWGDAATWTSGDAPGTFPNAVDATVDVNKNITTGNLVLDIQDASNINQNYRVGDFSYLDTTSTYRSLVLQNGTLTVDTTDKVAVWQNNTAYSGTAPQTSFESTVSIAAAADQTLELSIAAAPTVSTTDTAGTKFVFNSSATWTNFAGTLQFGKGVFQPLATDALPQSVAVTLGTGTNVAYLRLTHNQSQTLRALSGNAQSFVHNGTHDTTRPTLTILGTANGTFAGTVGTNGDPGFTRAGVNLVKNGAMTQTFSGSIVNSGSVVMNLGTLVLSGDNTYSGGTTVNSGLLLVNNATGSGTGSGAVLINAGGTLGGTGTVGGATTVEGALAPGASAESLNFTSSLTLQGTPSITMQVQGAARGVAGGYDAVDVGTALTYAGTLTVDFSQTFADGTSFNLFSFNSSTGDLSAIQLSGAYSGSLQSQGGGQWSGSIGGQNFQFTTQSGSLSIVVPEPTSLAFAAIGVMTLCHRRRREA